MPLNGESSVRAPWFIVLMISESGVERSTVSEGSIFRVELPAWNQVQNVVGNPLESASMKSSCLHEMKSASTIYMKPTSTIYIHSRHYMHCDTKSNLVRGSCENVLLDGSLQSLIVSCSAQINDFLGSINFGYWHIWTDHIYLSGNMRIIYPPPNHNSAYIANLYLPGCGAKVVFWKNWFS
jgi:hypothetical protein